MSRKPKADVYCSLAEKGPECADAELAHAMPSAGSGSTTTGVRTAAAVGVQLAIALVHTFRLGSHLRGRLFVLYYGYFSDIIIPFGMYFLLCMLEARVRAIDLSDAPEGVKRKVAPVLAYVSDWRLKAALVFGVASFTEILQAFGVPLLGRTFDPLDFAMFAGGVLLAVLADKFLLERLFPYRSPGRSRKAA